MKLIVGLGNPGTEYENTRHNVGFMIIDNYANQYNAVINKNKLNGLYTEISLNNEKIILLKPQKYMNLSGEVVKSFINFYKINVEDIIIINDDLDMPVGKIKLKQQGSSGGHNGLKNIEQHLGTDEYKRLKIGISNNKDIDTKNYVLGKFSKEDKEILNKEISLSKQILDDFLTLNFDKVMNKYNTK